MPSERSHFAVSGRLPKLPVGPIDSPSPGPTLQIAVAAPDIAVMKLSPSADRLAARRTKHTIYKKKKPITAFETVSGISFLL